MGGGTTQTSNSSQSSDPQVTSTLNQLLGGVSNAYSAGPTYTAPGATTTGSQTAALGAAANPDYASGVNGAIASYAPVAAGADIGQNDPGYAALRANLANTVTTDTNASFNNSGLFGSNNNATATAQGLGNALGSLDYQQYQDSLARQNNAAAQLPSLYQAAQLPAGTQAAVGAAQDTATQAGANKNISLLDQLSGILQGTAPIGGTTSTATQPSTPWWQSILGIGASLL